MDLAIQEAQKALDSNTGGPFGAIVVKDGIVIASSHNQVTSTNDPTAHAEVNAIREACQKLGKFQLDDCMIYTSCEPCPMCLGAIYWARPKKVFYALSRIDAAEIGFDDQFIYNEINKDLSDREIEFEELKSDSANSVFQNWKLKTDKINY